MVGRVREVRYRRGGRVRAAVACVNRPRRVEAGDAGEAGEGGLRAVRETHARVYITPLRGGVHFGGEGAGLAGGERGVLPARGRARAVYGDAAGLAAHRLVDGSVDDAAERSEERRVGKECRS